MKTCTKCGQAKPVEAFALARARRDGRYPSCKDCNRGYHDDYRARHRARRRAQQQEYISQNLHIRWAGKYRGRCHDYGLPIVLEDFTRQDVIERYGDACAWCGGDWSELDHVIAVRDGGPHTLGNVRPSCSDCNKSREQQARKARKEAHHV